MHIKFYRQGQHPRLHGFPLPDAYRGDGHRQAGGGPQRLRDRLHAPEHGPAGAGGVRDRRLRFPLHLRPGPGERKCYRRGYKLVGAEREEVRLLRLRPRRPPGWPSSDKWGRPTRQP